MYHKLKINFCSNKPSHRILLEKHPCPAYSLRKQRMIWVIILYRSHYTRLAVSISEEVKLTLSVKNALRTLNKWRFTRMIDVDRKYVILYFMYNNNAPTPAFGD